MQRLNLDRFARRTGGTRSAADPWDVGHGSAADRYAWPMPAAADDKDAVIERHAWGLIQINVQNSEPT